MSELPALNSPEEINNYLDSINDPIDKAQAQYNTNTTVGKAQVIVNWFNEEKTEFFLNVDKRDYPFNKKTNRMLDDKEMNAYWLECQEHSGVAIGYDLWKRVVKCERMNTRSPLREMFLGGEYKSQAEAVAKILSYTDYFKLKDPKEQEFFNEVMVKWFIGAVAGVMREDYFNNIFPVIVGDNATGKSYILKRLLPENMRGLNFCECSIPTSTAKIDKDMEARITDSFIIYFDEMVNVHKMQGDWLRNVLDRTSNIVRLAYREFDRLIMRHSSFIGSTNDASSIISDPQNNRRIVPFHIKDNDERLKGGKFDEFNIQEVWQAAKYLYDEGVDHEFTTAQIKRVKARSSNYAYDDMYEFFVDHCIKESGDFLTSSEVAAKARNLYPANEWKVGMMGKYLTRASDKEDSLIKKVKTKGASGYRCRVLDTKPDFNEEPLPF